MALPSIQVNERQTRDVSDDALRALIAANMGPAVFWRGDHLVRFRVDDERPRLEVLDVDRLSVQLARAADWYRATGRKKRTLVATSPPTLIAKDILSRVGWPGFPRVVGIVRTPVFTRNGFVGSQGYDPDSGLICYPDAALAVPRVSSVPSPSDVKTALEQFEDVLCDFPFSDGASKSHSVAAMIEPFVRARIHGPTPLYLIDANTPGTGKGLLAHAICFPTLGRQPAVLTECNSESEARKRITALLLDDPAFVLMDNVNNRIDSSSLAAVLTNPFWTDRVLGVSRMVTLPVRATWLATGNNIATSNEISRRVVHIRLSAETERPWLRSGFRHPSLVTRLKQVRSNLAWSCLTLAQAWVAQGCPAGHQSLGSYESWSAVLGGILSVAGISGFLENAVGFYDAADDEMAPWRELITEWWTSHRTAVVGVQALYELSRWVESMEELLGDSNEQSQRTRLGKALSRMRDRVVGDVRIISAPSDNSGRKRYQLVPVKPRAVAEVEGDVCAAKIIPIR